MTGHKVPLPETQSTRHTALCTPLLASAKRTTVVDFKGTPSLLPSQGRGGRACKVGVRPPPSPDETLPMCIRSSIRCSGSPSTRAAIRRARHGVFQVSSTKHWLRGKTSEQPLKLHLMKERGFKKTE